MRRVGLVSCTALPEEDPDRQLLLEAVRARGPAAEWVSWDDPSVAWDAFSVVVLRSTWNYFHDLPAFLAWVDRAAAVTSVVNPPAVVRWNTHKRYLAELEARGLPVVPTEILPRGTPVSLEALCRRRGWTDVVVKPAVSAGSFRTRRAAVPDAGAQAFLEEALAARDMMVQPYQRSVEGHGERSLVVVDGELTHAIRKSPRFAGGHESVTGPLPIPGDERDTARRILAAVDGELLYARVDLARDDAGVPRLMELELVEPSLFLRQHPPALARLADRIAALAAAR